MIRKIIQIDTDKCNGCGACANACHEGAIAMVNGKAKLMRDDYCDGFGDCLPHCPTGAITFVEREAAAYSEQLLKQALTINPTGIDPNFFYGDFLLEQGDKAQAKIYLDKALAAPARPGREVADEGRKTEIRERLAKL